MLIGISILLGLLIGSFLNVCIYRIPRHEEIVYTPSHCMACGHTLRWYELFPVFSYLTLGGKCKNCKIHISKQYPIIELINGLAYGFLYMYYGLSIDTVLMMALFSVLLVVFMIDYKTLTIPNGLVIFIGVLGVVNTFYHRDEWITYVIGFFAASLVLLLIAIITKGKMGGGDIKLMAVAGLVIGWQNILLALFIGSIFGAIIGLTLIALKVMDRKEMIPFGPYLCVGIMISALYGAQIIEWYLKVVIG